MAVFKYSQEQLQDAFWKRWQQSMEFEGPRDDGSMS